jgi:hypothetical protein
MTPMRNVAVKLAILVGTIGGVAAATLGIVALVVPASVTVGDAPTPEPSFDVDVAPVAIGGRLDITGDRTGTMEFDAVSGIGSRYQVEGDVVSVAPASDPTLSGPDGRIAFDRDTAEITVIEYDDLALYPDPGECTVTEGAINDEAGLMAALVDCPGVEDIRGHGVVNVTGVVALPIETIRGRGDLPPSGGTLVLERDEGDGPEADEVSVSLEEAELFLDVVPNEGDDRLTAGSFTEQGGVAVQYDPAADAFYLTDVSVGDQYATASEPCPIAAEDLGRISQTTRVVRLTIDCIQMTDIEGNPVSATGTIVVDIIHGLNEGGGP